MQISLKLLLVAFWGVLTLTVKSNAQESSPQAGNLESLWDTERVLDNPHKGLYHHFYANSTGAYGWLGQDVQVYPGLKYLYIRLAWSYFEPYDDQYDWHLIDEVVEQYWPQGYKIALSITAKETDPAVHWGGEELNQVVDGVVYATPKWVRDAGAQGQVVDNWGAQHWEPRYDDPVFLDKLDEFHVALAARYDGKPYVRNLGWNTGKRAGDEWYFWAEWLNQGVAPAYHPYQLSVRLEGPVTKTFTIADARNRDWLDGKNHWETYLVKLPADMPGGDYQVKLKLYDPRTQRDVDLGFKTSIKDKDGYFKLGNVALEAPLTGSGSITPGTYRLLARHSNKALDVRKRSIDPGANVQQWAYAGTPNQQWQIASAGNSYYTLKAKHSDLALSVDLAADPATADGVNIFQYGTNEQDNRLWKIEPVGEGYYKLTNKYSGKVLDVAGGVETNGANVIQWQYKSGANQRWKLVPVNANARTASSQKQTSTEKIETPDLRLYPNPAHAQLMMEAADNKDYQLTVYDLTGRRMMQREHLNGKTSLDISRLRPGVYIVKMSDGVHPQLRQRIIVE